MSKIHHDGPRKGNKACSVEWKIRKYKCPWCRKELTVEDSECKHGVWAWPEDEHEQFKKGPKFSHPHSE